MKKTVVWLLWCEEAQWECDGCEETRKMKNNVGWWRRRRRHGMLFTFCAEQNEKKWRKNKNRFNPFGWVDVHDQRAHCALKRRDRYGGICVPRRRNMQNEWKMLCNAETGLRERCKSQRSIVLHWRPLWLQNETESRIWQFVDHTSGQWHNETRHFSPANRRPNDWASTHKTEQK